MLSPIVAPPNPWGAMILTNSYLHYVRKLPYKFQLSWPIGSGEEDFQSKNGFRYRGLTRPTGVMILTNIYLHNVGKLPYKFQLSWPSGSGEEDFQSFFLYKHM